MRFLYKDYKIASDALIGLDLDVSGEENLWRQQSEYNPIIGYTFSRGYAYEFTPRFNKASLELAMPAAYPNWGYKGWIFFNRIYANFFFDHALSEFNRGNRTLNSGGES